LQPNVTDESIWQGTDANAFRTRWSSQTATLFDDLVGQLTRQAEDVENHADERDDVSASDGAGGGGQGGGGGDDKSLWDRLTDGGKVWNKFQGLWNNGKKI